MAKVREFIESCADCQRERRERRKSAETVRYCGNCSKELKRIATGVFACGNKRCPIMVVIEKSEVKHGKG